MNRKKSNIESVTFDKIIAQAMETLTTLRREVYTLHLYGWMNREIEERTGLRFEHVCEQLYEGKKDTKNFIRQNYHYSPKKVHQEIVDLQRNDPEFFKDMVKFRWVCRKKAAGKGSPATATIGDLKDRYIEARRAELNVTIDDYLTFELPKNEKHELREQLEEYEAAQEGLERLVNARIDFEAFRQRLRLANADRSDERITN